MADQVELEVLGRQVTASNKVDGIIADPFKCGTETDVVPEAVPLHPGVGNHPDSHDDRVIAAEFITCQAAICHDRMGPWRGGPFGLALDEGIGECRKANEVLLVVEVAPNAEARLEAIGIGPEVSYPECGHELLSMRDDAQRTPDHRDTGIMVTRRFDPQPDVINAPKSIAIGPSLVYPGDSHVSLASRPRETDLGGGIVANIV
ncbi:hypothetical protein CH330_05605 [candidate division WOR-3 bacterium JGI_Cruoil_03_51_56]|uniref:Uncharacterized protein n=1 Tax=candidate division WOR-3 bacterium JGI_Cruoil_03_51_56 TaxID=1973747 RepID=A0A235BT28_UNCW3|nr:MAG: hypothetical protein CH330_05605 [candidate division WOR-3 bacterium JGI_Cruoil_03_51_56]